MLWKKHAVEVMQLKDVLFSSCNGVDVSVSYGLGVSGGWW